MDFINIEKVIELNNKAIKNRIEKSGLTKEQLEKGFELTRLKDEVLEINENGLIDMHKYDADTEEFDIVITANSQAQHKMTNMFNNMCKLLDFDYEELIEIQRLKEETELFEEIYEDEGFGIRIDTEVNYVYYLFGKGTIYRWTTLNPCVKDLELTDVEDYILTDKYVKKAIETLF